MKNNEETLRKEIRMMESKIRDEEKRTEKLSNDLKEMENEVENLKDLIT